MKKNLLVLFAFFHLTTISLAQVVVTSATFPQIGDTLKVAVDNLPENIEITAAGGNQIWDYSGLSAPFEAIDIYRDASEGSVFDQVPDATLFFETAQAGESYFKVNNNTLELLAVNGGGGGQGGGFDLNTLLRFNPPLVERRALTFPQQDISNTSVFIALATDDLPQEILDILDLPLLPDSLRINIETERIDFVDAWGSMTIPGGIYDVLRVKRTETNNISVEALVPILGWTDVTDLVAPFLADLGNGTSVSYLYYNDVEKEVIANVSMNEDETEVTQVIFKSNEIVNSTATVTDLSPNIFAYPNPAIFDTRFEFTNLKTGDYKLKVYNILGVNVMEKNYYISGSRTVKVDLNTLTKGTYLYSLVDGKGKTLMTKRLMIVRP
ncbi:MAG: T9SS type A sorting domain-containing protein [Saprospiraceae bacterium]|jgi:hypothetical protein|nr:T9SS type A sorting domain-containing protein [Saprospiraceae bacterium]